MNPVLKKLGLYSIQGRLTAIAFFFILVTALTLGVAGYRFTVEFESNRYRDHFVLLASYLASNAELGVLLENQQILAGLCENMLSVQDVQQVEIIDNQGRQLILRSQQEMPDELIHISAPVMAKNLSPDDAPFLERQNENQALGQVRLSYARSGLVQLKKILALRFLILSPLLAIVPAILYWRVSRTIRAPLKAVLYLADEVVRGNMNVRATTGGLYETSVMAAALNEMLDALQAQRQQLKEANAAIAHQQVLAEVGKFSMIVAHEIKNPLAVIKGSLAILRKPEVLDPQVKEQMIGYVDEEIVRVNKLVEDFLLFARPRTPAFRDILVLDLLANLAERLRLLDSRVLVLVDVPADLMEAQLQCDIALLERALFNVVRNALEAGDTKVRVDVDATEQFLAFRVRDQGQGFNPNEIDSIFEPFFSTKAKGTGLGLAIAKEVIDAHQGHISAANNPDGGACLELKIPLAPNPEPQTPNG
jgi:signal transduction histidine kinase